ncbi:hypothetical protein [Brevibacillus daliensis]|nr:hypothetical protein [Brevibacillus daliensis]
MKRRSWHDILETIDTTLQRYPMVINNDPLALAWWIVVFDCW